MAYLITVIAYLMVKILKDKIKHAVADEGIVKAVESL
ncbi:hypothetical protein ES707_15479 [subsurface metagenome]